MKNDCKIKIRRWEPKVSGAAEARWDRARINEIVGEIVTVGNLTNRGLTRADIQYEIGHRQNFAHICRSICSRR